MVDLYAELILQFCASQWRSQNAGKVTHIKGRLLDQAVIIFNCVPFQNVNFSKKKEFAPRGNEFFPLRAVPYRNSLLPHWVTSLDCYYFITHVRNCVMGATPMPVFLSSGTEVYLNGNSKLWLFEMNNEKPRLTVSDRMEEFLWIQMVKHALTAIKWGFNYAFCYAWACMYFHNSRVRAAKALKRLYGYVA